MLLLLAVVLLLLAVVLLLLAVVLLLDRLWCYCCWPWWH